MKLKEQWKFKNLVVPGGAIILALLLFGEEMPQWAFAVFKYGLCGFILLAIFLLLMGHAFRR